MCKASFNIISVSAKILLPAPYGSIIGSVCMYVSGLMKDPIKSISCMIAEVFKKFKQEEIRENTVEFKRFLCHTTVWLSSQYCDDEKEANLLEYWKDIQRRAEIRGITNFNIRLLSKIETQIDKFKTKKDVASIKLA
eukprot:358449_1